MCQRHAVAVTTIVNCIRGAIMPGHLAVEFTGSKSNCDPRYGLISIVAAGDATYRRRNWPRQFAMVVCESIDTRDLSQFATAI